MVQLISNLNAAINNINMYTAAHPQAKRYLETAYLNLSDLLRIKGKIDLLAIEGNLIVDNSSLKATGPHLTQFVGILNNSAIERLTFISGMPKRNFMELIQFLSADESKPIRSSEYIKLGIIDLKVKDNPGGSTAELSEEQLAQLEELKELRNLKREEFKALCQDIKHRKRTDIQGVEDVIKVFVDGFANGINPLDMLVSVKSAEELMFTHALNVCILTMSQAESLGMTGQHLHNIGIAAVMHDVGKLFIPDEILKKPDALTERERRVMESHTVLGAQHLLQSKDIPHLAVLGALEHHMQYDGKGYPVLKADWKPNIASQMIGLSNAFEKLWSRPSDTDPAPMDLTAKTLAEEKSVACHPVLVDNFIEIVQR